MHGRRRPLARRRPAAPRVRLQPPRPTEARVRLFLPRPVEARVRFFLPRPVGEGRGEGLPGAASPRHAVAPSRPHHASNPAEKRPASPQEFFRKNSYCAREPRFRRPSTQRHRPRPRRPAQTVPREGPSSPLRLFLPRPVGEGRSPPLRLLLPRPVGEGGGEGLPGTAPRLTRVASGRPAAPHPSFRRPQPESSPRPPARLGRTEKGPASPQEFFRKNSYCARTGPAPPRRPHARKPA